MERTNQTTAIQKLGEMIQGIPTAMMTTCRPDGVLRSRPMMAQKTEFDGVLWFFTKLASGKVDEIQEHQEVNVSYVYLEEQRYVSVSGTVTVVRDQAQIHDQWDQSYLTWFPKGVDDPDLGLLKVAVHAAEYWEGSQNEMVEIPLLGRAVLPGSGKDTTEHEQLDLGETN